MIFTLNNSVTFTTYYFESENKKGFIYGFTENYVRVKTNWSFKLANTITKRKISRIDDDGHVILEPVKKLITV